MYTSFSSFCYTNSCHSQLRQVYGANGLVKRELLSLPDPFGVLTVDGEQTSTTAIVRRSLSPVWNETFDMCASNILPFSYVHADIVVAKSVNRP